MPNIEKGVIFDGIIIPKSANAYGLSSEKGVGYLESIITARQIKISSAQFTAIKNIEDGPTILLGKMSLLQSSLQKVEKVTDTITKTVLSAKLIFSNKIKLG